MLPWWIKIIAKLFLSRMPISYRLFARLGILRHGKMDNADYAYGVFKKHFDLFQGAGMRWVGAEIGPGDSVFSAILAKAYGADGYWLIDAGNFADRSLGNYLKMYVSLKNRHFLKGIVGLTDAGDFDALLHCCNAQYLINGVQDLSRIPDGSVDFVWSNATLEHISAQQFDLLCQEMYRLLRPGGLASHQVDYKDHLANSLNNLRFSKRFWELEWFASASGFYTNRIRPKAMRLAFENAGFCVQVIDESKWSQMPIPYSKLSSEFVFLEKQDLLVQSCHYLLTKPDK